MTGERRAPASWEQALHALESKRSPEALVELHARGLATRGEVFSALLSSSSMASRPLREQVLAAMTEHNARWVRDMAPEIRERLGRGDDRGIQSEHPRHRSPLKSGTVVVLSHGYEGPDSWWLGGRSHYRGAFEGFLPREAKQKPAALVRLDTPIHRVEADGTVHRGQHAILSLLYRDEDWGESGTVTVHIVEAVPDDLNELYSSSPARREIESHASYRIDHEATGNEP